MNAVPKKKEDRRTDSKTIESAGLGCHEVAGKVKKRGKDLFPGPALRGDRVPAVTGRVFFHYFFAMTSIS